MQEVFLLFDESDSSKRSGVLAFYKIFVLMNATAHIKKDHYKTHVQAGENSIIADEPANKGGTELGFSPDELLLAALGACTSITLRM